MLRVIITRFVMWNNVRFDSAATSFNLSSQSNRSIECTGETFDGRRKCVVFCSGTFLEDLSERFGVNATHSVIGVVMLLKNCHFYHIDTFSHKLWMYVTVSKFIVFSLGWGIFHRLRPLSINTCSGRYDTIFPNRASISGRKLKTYRWRLFDPLV